MADPLLQKLDTLLVVEQPATTGASDTRGNGRKTLAPATPSAPTPTGAGAGSTTFVSADLNATNDFDYIGNWLEAQDGPNLGQLVRITQFNAAADTATHEAWPNATAPTRVRMWLPADPVVPATAAGADTSTMTSTVRDEATGYWARASAGTTSNSKKYMLVCLGSANASQVGAAREITQHSYAAGTATFTVGAVWPNIPASGDLYVIRKFVRTMGEWAPEQAFFERGGARASFDEIEGVAGPRGGTLTFATEVKGSGVAASAGVVAVPPLESSTLLEAMLTEQQDTGDTLVAQAGTAPPNSTVSLAIATGNLTRFTVGNFVLVNGEAAVVTATAPNGADPDSLTIEPALGQTPATGATIAASATYRPRTIGHLATAMEMWIGNRARWEAWGGMSDVVVDLAPNALPKLSWSFAMADHRERYESAGLPYTPIEDTRMPFDAKALRVVLDSTTLDLVRSAKLTIGYVIEMRPALGNGRAGEVGAAVVGRKSTIDLELEYEDVARSEGYVRQFAAGTVVNCLLQHGTIAGDTVAVYAPRAVVMEAPKIGTDGGRHTLGLKLKPIQPTATAVTTATTLATVAIGWM